MAIRYFYMNPLAVAVELTDRVWTALTWHSSAEELNAVQGEWVIEDPDSDLLLYAWRRVYVLDDDAPIANTVIGMGFIADVHVRRSEVYGRTPASRAWHLTITDLNYMPNYPLFDAGDSPDRPIETDLARIAWYLTTQEAGHFDSNTDFIDTTGGVTLDAYNLLTQSPYDLFRGAMDQSGRNAFVGYDETVGPPDFATSTGELFIWYAKPSSALWPALVSLSNDPADIDPSTGTFPLAEEDLDLHLDPTRIAWKLHMAYDGGMVAVSDDTIATTYTAREMRVDASDLTTSAKSTTRGNRMLQEGRIPAARIQWGYHTRADYVNGLMAGQSFQYRATHLGGLTDLGIPDFSQAGGVQVRAMDRTVVEKGPGQYYVSGSAVPTGAGALGEGSFYVGQDNDFIADGPSGGIYVNGTFCGVPSDHSAFDRDERFEIPAGLLHTGTNVIAVGVINGVEPTRWEFGNPTGLLLRAYLGLDDLTSAIAYTSTSTKVWVVENTPSGTIGGTPTDWYQEIFDDSAWDGAESVGSVPYSGVDGFDDLLPPTAPAIWIAPPGSTIGDYDRGMVWLSRITFEID